MPGSVLVREAAGHRAAPLAPVTLNLRRLQPGLCRESRLGPGLPERPLPAPGFCELGAGSVRGSGPGAGPLPALRLREAAEQRCGGAGMGEGAQAAMRRGLEGSSVVSAGRQRVGAGGGCRQQTQAGDAARGWQPGPHFFPELSWRCPHPTSALGMVPLGSSEAGGSDTSL